jgi:hypothetical protein
MVAMLLVTTKVEGHAIQVLQAAQHETAKRVVVCRTGEGDALHAPGRIAGDEHEVRHFVIGGPDLDPAVDDRLVVRIGRC